MTRREALEALLVQVEAGEWPGGIDGIARQVFPYKSARYDDHGLLAAEAFNGSLDAAKALHEAVLPGWRISSLGQRTSGYQTWLSCGGHKEVAAEGYSDPARAWLIAILKALIAQEGDE